eukprot:Rmarinus@m.17935
MMWTPRQQPRHMTCMIYLEVPSWTSAKKDMHLENVCFRKTLLTAVCTAMRLVVRMRCQPHGSPRGTRRSRRTGIRLFLACHRWSCRVLRRATSHGKRISRAT